MGWFDEQIRQRKQIDQDLFEDSLFGMASAVLGSHDAGVLNDRRIVTKAVIDEILKYYHLKPVEIPNSVKEPEEQLAYALRPYGLMYRRVTLTKNWYKASFGPLIAFRREDGMPVAVLPKIYGGYLWYDAAGNRVSGGRHTADQLEPEAICFYRPLPQKKLRLPDLLTYVKGCLNLADYAVLLGLTLLVTLTGMLLPLLTRLLTGFVLESGSPLILWSTAVFLFCVLLSTQVLSVARELAIARLQIKAAVPLEGAMMMRLMSLPAGFFRQFSAGELASRVGEIHQISVLLMGGVFSLGITAIASLLYVNQIFSYAPALVMPVLVILLLTAAATVLTGVMETRKTREFRKADAEADGISFALISGIQKLKLSGAEKRAFARWARVFSRGAEIKFNPPLFLKISSAVLMAIPLLGTIALYYYAAESGISPSAYLAFYAAYGVVTGAFSAFGGTVTSAAQILPILEMAEPILEAEPEMAEEKEIVTKLSGGIEFSGVSFRYQENGPYVIDDLNLKVKAGEYVAVVGRTGCGKSTLMRLLLGFETPEKGAIYYDRKDIRSLDLQSLRRKMGVVTQDGSLFLGAIFANITVSAPRLTLTEAWEAAELAGIADDIRAMPMGMQTVIGEGQGGISGGQKQRIMIARAIAPKPKILLLDEATSALDNRIQKQVSDALAHLNCTRIVIAHRLSTIQNCDRILVLDGGKIAEEGTYSELIRKDGIFAELVARQRIDL